MGILLLRDRRRFAQYLQVERRGHIVSLAESLQSLELVQGLKELTVDRRLITHDGRMRRPLKSVLPHKRFCFVPGSHAEPPVFISDAGNKLDWSSPNSRSLLPVWTRPRPNRRYPRERLFFHPQKPRRRAFALLPPVTQQTRLGLFFLPSQKSLNVFCT